MQPASNASYGYSALEEGQTKTRSRSVPAIHDLEAPVNNTSSRLSAGGNVLPLLVVACLGSAALVGTVFTISNSAPSHESATVSKHQIPMPPQGPWTVEEPQIHINQQKEPGMTIATRINVTMDNSTEKWLNDRITHFVSTIADDLIVVADKVDRGVWAFQTLWDVLEVDYWLDYFGWRKKPEPQDPIQGTDDSWSFSRMSKAHHVKDDVSPVPSKKEVAQAASLMHEFTQKFGSLEKHTQSLEKAHETLIQLNKKYGVSDETLNRMNHHIEGFIRMLPTEEELKAQVMKAESTFRRLKGIALTEGSKGIEQFRVLLDDENRKDVAMEFDALLKQKGTQVMGEIDNFIQQMTGSPSVHGMTSTELLDAVKVKIHQMTATA